MILMSIMGTLMVSFLMLPIVFKAYGKSATDFFAQKNFS